MYRYVKRYPKRYSKYSKRYTRSNKRYTKSRRLTRQGIPLGIPTQQIARLRYVDYIALTSTTGVLSDYVFRANSLYDPNYTGTGHQPMGFDTWAASYNHYIVIGSKITVTFVEDNTSSSSVPHSVGIYLADTNTLGYTTMEGLVESGAKSVLINPRQPSGHLVLSEKFSAKKFFNVKDMRDNMFALGAQVSTNPGDDGYFHVWLQAHDAGSAEQRCKIVIDFIAIFSEPKQLPQS